MLFTKTGSYPSGTNKYALEAQGSSQAEAIRKLRERAEEKGFTLISHTTDKRERIHSLLGSRPHYTTYYASVGEGYFTNPEAEERAQDGRLIYDPPTTEIATKGSGWLR